MSPNAEDVVKVAVIGTGDGGIQSGIVTTLGAQPNILVKVIGPVAAILIRFVNLYLTLTLGIITAGMTTNMLPVHDFADLVGFAAKLALSGAVVGLIKDLVTIFGRLESKFPMLTGNV